MSTLNMTPAERVKRILDEATGSDLTSKEKHEFLPSIINRTELSPKQEEWLGDIERRLFGNEDEE